MHTLRLGPSPMKTRTTVFCSGAPCNPLLLLLPWVSFGGNGDNGGNLLSRSHSERQIHLMSLTEKRRIIDESYNSVPAICVNTLDRPGTGDSNFTIYER